MPKLDKPYGVTLILLAGLSFFPLAIPTSFKMDESKSDVFLKFPSEIAGWKGTEVPVDERTYEILETRNVLSRVYENPKGEKVHLLLVGSHKDRRVAHPPEVCYLSSNYNIADETEGIFTSGTQQIQVKQFLAKSERNPEDREKVAYVYKIGDRYTTNYYAQQLQFAMDQLTRKKSQVLLIRLAGSNQSAMQELFSRIIPLLS